jgi:hypothetical protein
MDAIGSSFARFLLAGALAGDAPALELEVVGAERDLRAWVRPIALALPRGFLRADERIAVIAEGGRELPASVAGAWAHADGSIALARIELAPLPLGVARLRIEARRATSAPPEAPTTSAPTDAAATELSLRAGASAIAFDLGATTLFEEGAGRRVTRMTPRSRAAPDGAGARGGVELAFDDDIGPPLGALRLDWEVTPGADALEVEAALTVAHDGLLERLVVAGRAVGERPRLGLGREEAAAEAGGVRVLRAPLAELARDAAAGGAAEPMTLRVGSGVATVELAWEEFAQARPSAAWLRPNGQFELELTSEPLSLRAGQVVRRRLLLHVVRSGGVARTRSWLVPVGRARGFDAATAALLDRWREFLGQELLAPARLDDRGCYATPKGERADGEYDLAGNLYWLGVRERDARWLALARTCARHTVDFDRTTQPVGGAPAGLFFMHGEEHQSGRVEAGHQWIEGTLGLARTEGSLEACDAARGLVRALDQWRAVPQAFEGPERRLAWPLQAAAATLELVDDATAKRVANACANDLLARQNGAGFIDGDRRPVRDTSCAWVNCWVSAGITANALARASPVLGRRTHEAASRLVAFVAGECMSREGCAEVLLVDPATAQVVRRQGRCRRGDAALVAAGLDLLADEAGFAALRDQLFAQAVADLAEPRREDVEHFAKLLLALRQRAEGSRSFMRPSSSLVRPRPK